MSQRCETTQGIPAPQGPREQAIASVTRGRTAPPATNYKQRETIPLEEFVYVLCDSEHYSKLYPDTLPLTRKLWLQVRNWKPPTPTDVPMASAAVPVSRAQEPHQVVLADVLGRQFLAELAAAGDTVVEQDTRGRKRPPSPIGAEREFVPRERVMAIVPPAPFPDPPEHMFKSTWTKLQDEDVLQPHTNANKRSLPPTRAEPRARSRSRSIPRGLFRVPCIDPASFAGPGHGGIRFSSDSEGYDEDEPQCQACGYGRPPSMLDMAERGEWLRSQPQLSHSGEYRAIMGTGYNLGTREWAFPSACASHGAMDCWRGED